MTKYVLILIIFLCLYFIFIGMIIWRRRWNKVKLKKKDLHKCYLVWELKQTLMRKSSTIFKTLCKYSDVNKMCLIFHTKNFILCIFRIESSDDTWSPNREPEVDLSSDEDETIEMDSGTDDSGDEDYTPYTHIRTGVALQKTLQLETLQEINIEDTVHDCNIPEATDATPVPDKVVVNIPGDIIGQPVSMVYHKCMQQLAEFLLLPVQVCTEKDPQTSEECGASAPFIINISSRGTAMIVKWCCPKSHVVWQWNSQPTVKFGMQAGDFMLSSNILLSGNNFAKIALMFKYMNMGMVTRNTFFSVQNAYCVDTIKEYWTEKRTDIISEVKERGHVVALGDGRMDSPGFCAQYCTYTLMDNDTRKILSIENVDKRETQRSSTIMEREAFIRSVDKVSQEVKLSEVCTDAHSQISALFRHVDRSTPPCDWRT
ncbi:uncharacterized protein [Nothobranchius furzeri]|uniref:uncharacterized protein isoform X2 n=1 Tax=Nothobranchius furzeri TaxID=105023 RepID=UPI003904D777